MTDQQPTVRDEETVKIDVLGPGTMTNPWLGRQPYVLLRLVLDPSGEDFETRVEVGGLPRQNADFVGALGDLMERVGKGLGTISDAALAAGREAPTTVRADEASS